MVAWNYFLIWNQETSEQLCASYIQDILTNKNIVTFIFKHCLKTNANRGSSWA
jgi:hypothetical protein